jgi:diguanylate cyclase (GGDEF)-like protein
VIEKMAITDGLTGLFNRMHLLSRFEQEFKRAKRLKNNLGCIMLDIDQFKSINDKYGHLTGDEVLREISLRLRNSIRIYDVLGRYGGEEFLIVLPDTDFENAKSLAERIRNNIKENLIATIQVTISLGITSISEKDKTINDMINRADEALYKSKNSGRDLVEWL